MIEAIMKIEIEIGFNNDTSDNSDFLTNLEQEKAQEVTIEDFKHDITDSIDNSENEGESSENKQNDARLVKFSKDLTPKFLDHIENENFEFGYISKSETLIRVHLKINALATRNWLNGLFIEHFNNDKIIIGILRIIGRFSEAEIFPQGQTIALAALNHKNAEIKELGIRAFENWCSLNSLRVLKSLDIDQDWLNAYLQDVISDLEEEVCHY